MSLEISPVLAGTFDAPDYASTHNFASATIPATPSVDTASATEDTSGVDQRRYTQFDRSATDAGTTTMSFGDFLDMINPLEHIPVVSAVYRAATNEQINPVSRTVGDILYGGLMGGASAVLGGLSAVADAGIEAQTGKTAGGMVVAALFGSDDGKNAIQVADAENTVSSSNIDNARLPVQETEPAQIASANPGPVVSQASVNASSPTTQFAAAPQSTTAPPAILPASVQTAANNAATESDDPTSTGIPINTAKSYPLNRQASGSTASPSSVQGVAGAANTNIQAQDMAIALSEGAPGMRLGHTIYTSQLVNGPHPLPPMISPATGIAVSAQAQTSPTAPVIAPPPVVPAVMTPISSSGNAAPTVVASPIAAPVTGSLAALMQSSPQKTPISPDLMQDMMLKAISQYGGVASASATTPGTVFNLTN
jgi:hypothetical protein